MWELLAGNHSAVLLCDVLVGVSVNSIRNT